MTIEQLIEKLKALPPQMEVTILDGFNGEGVPRTINFGPQIFNPQDEDKTFEGDERQDYDDISSEPGTPIVIMGFGCY